MNIFVLDKNPEKAARYLCDKHVVKMILESAQLLCTAHRVCDKNCKCKILYKSTHVNHPCSIWVRESLGNYNWLVRHALEMCREYKRRYGREHKSCEVVEWCAKNSPKIKKKKMTAFVLAMPDKYKNKDAVKAYRNFYLHEKMRFAKWKNCKKPGWVKK